ncbi:phosphoadenylyl-sulfate reductase [Desmospora activa]|nr:phosphoadenylyl-sulfate reductase [Desmospora activa]
MSTEVAEVSDQEAVKEAAQALRRSSPQEVLQWGVGRFGNSFTLACSFGLEDVVLVDMLFQLNPEIEIFYLDTDLLFAETHQTRERLSKRYGKHFIRVVPELSLKEQEEDYGETLWKRDPHTCCAIRKVEPLRRFLSDYRAWCTGIRREQSPTRSQAETVEWDEIFQMAKLNPLAHWTIEEVWDYVHKNRVPFNPMHEQMYPSIGCIPCTQQVRPGEDSRAGRWRGMSRTECGLHQHQSGSLAGGK